MNCDKCGGRLLPNYDLDSLTPVMTCINCGWVPGLRREPTDIDLEHTGWDRRPVQLPIRPLNHDDQLALDGLLIDEQVSA